MKDSNRVLWIFVLSAALVLFGLGIGYSQPLTLGDDDAVEVSLPFTFPFCGNNYTSVWVGSNGFFTFGVGDVDPLESISDLQFGPPRIAGLWDDLDPSVGGTITAATVGSDFVVTYSNVPEFDSTNSNSFSITLRSDGTFTFDYQSIDAVDGLVGSSPGDGHGGDPGEIDLSTEPQPIGGGVAVMVYELFDANDNDLSGSMLDFAACPPLLGPPDISTSPVFFTFTLPQGVTTTDALTISNTSPLGSEALNWQITDQEVVLRLNDGKEVPAKINRRSKRFQKNYRELRLDDDEPYDIGNGISARQQSVNSTASQANMFPQEGKSDIKQSNLVNAPDAANNVSLVLDDGSRENALGLTAGGQFLWLNRFTPFPGDFPFTLNEIWVLFGSGNGINVGELVDIYVWEDTDGDGNPGTGANLVGSINNAAVQYVDDVNFSSYTLTTPINLNGPGDVIIGVVNRTAGIAAGTFVASLDQTSSAGRSWIGLYSTGDPADPPVLPADDTFAPIDAIGFPGNWMIRGFEGTPPVDCPWISSSPVIGTTPPGGSFDVTITIDAPLMDGVYNCELIIDSNDPDEDPLNVPVQLTVSGPQQPPDIDVTPTSFTFNVPENGLTRSEMTISNTAPPFSQDLTWSIAEDSVMATANGKPVLTKLRRKTTDYQYRELQLSPAANEPNAGFSSDFRSEALSLSRSIPHIPIESFPAASANGRQVSLILDDGTIDNSIGLTAGGQFLWLNRFTPDPTDFPFTLNEVWVLFGAGNGVNIGELVDIYVYEDTDGDGNPGTGATFLTALNNAPVQAVDDVTFSQYTITPTVLNGPGDVLIAVVNRTAGADPGEFPAAIDQSTTAMRSWVGIYSNIPPDPPTLPADAFFGLIDNAGPGLAGNWMVRGFEGAPPPGCPWVSESPISATTGPGESVVVDISINATGLAAGTYICNLVISNNDPDEDPVTVPVTLNVGGPPQKAQPEICYASTGGADGGRLLTIDETTGAGALIGPTGLNGVPGLAINSNGSIFGTERSSGDLYRIDAATGSAVFVGSTNVPFLDGIAFDDNDVLYGVAYDPPDYTLLTVDTLTGDTTAIGPTGEQFTGLAFDAGTGLLWGSTGGFSPVVSDGIYTIEPATGASTLIGTTGLGGATPDLCFDATGNLYGSKGGGQNPNDLISIDKSTGAGSVVGPIGFVSVSGLASFSACLPGFLGDVNGDDLVNSTDALILLSFDAGLPLPPTIMDRINRGFGEVNGDGITNSTDALITLSFDVGIPVPFPIGDPVCL